MYSCSSVNWFRYKKRIWDKREALKYGWVVLAVKCWSYNTTIYVFAQLVFEVWLDRQDLLIKLVSPIFYQIIIFHQMIAFQKLWKMFFISFKKLFPFSRYSHFCIFVFPSFSLSCIALARVWFKKNLKVYDVIICLNKNLITRFVWYL